MKLVTLSGNPVMGAPQYQFSLFSLGGSGRIDPSDPMIQTSPLELSNVDAGIQALYIMAKKRPGLRWRDLMEDYSRVKMGANWFSRNIMSPSRSFLKWNTKTIASAGDKLGDWGGSAIRLLTDEQVMEGLSRYGAAYATGGQSEGIMGLLGGLGGGQGAPGMLEQFLASLGMSSKQQVKTAGAGGLIEGIDNKVLLVAGGGLLVLLLLLK